MKRLFGFVLILITFATLFECSHKPQIKDRATGTIHIIPQPAQLHPGQGAFTVLPGMNIVVNTKDSKVAETAAYLSETLSRISSYSIPVVSPTKAAEKSITFNLDSEQKNLGEEGYALDVSPQAVKLTAAAPAGLFWGVQTIFQLLPVDIYAQQTVKNTTLQIPSVKIEDVPRYSYRGMHLDVCRHYFPVKFIKRYIDLLAIHKMNVLHWHLTEDQGWRIEIKKYPKLTEISAFRDETLVGHYSDQPHKYDGKRYGGYYTQEEVRDIVAYAQKRNITVIPEIEMPGHSLAVLAAYPEFACTEGPFKVGTKWGVFEDVYCAGNDQVFTFLTDVLTEVVDLFPAKYIHIGGDECPKSRWEECEKCQARITREGLKDEHELQSYFIRRIEKFLLSKNRRLIGWDEILEGGLAPEATVMSWRGIEGGIEAAKQGHDVIMTPTSHCYFDYYQGDPKTEPLAIGGMLTLEKVYSYEPTPEELNASEAKHILGAQANVWTEYIKTPEKAEYMALPRMCALAEVVWSSKEHRNWKDFNTRLGTHFKRLDQLKVNYAKVN